MKKRLAVALLKNSWSLRPNSAIDPMTPEELDARIRRLEDEESWSGFFILILFISLILLVFAVAFEGTQVDDLQEEVEDLKEQQQ